MRQADWGGATCFIYRVEGEWHPWLLQQPKPKLEILARSSPKTNHMLAGSNLPSKVGSPAVPSTCSVTVASSKGEPSFNLYGYQPSQPMYITQAQLKAREESKSHHR